MAATRRLVPAAGGGTTIANLDNPLACDVTATSSSGMIQRLPALTMQARGSQPTYLASLTFWRPSYST
ncbi:hypothetical protein LTR62_001967 [Meristemomyces frigidus]|uniref:Uncharacterized protein n=1 Tax=Meristemomyces frigidus TaxID=1508187 RepID=A0AAN7T8M2_9PEZI|nr:hypothetical protein LTR62_001967 [Meristemomyces frigidus]